MINKILLTLMAFFLLIIIFELIFLTKNNIKEIINPSCTKDYSTEKALLILKDIPLITQKYLLGYASKSSNPLLQSSLYTVQIKGRITSIDLKGGKFDPNMPDTYRVKIDLADNNKTLTVYYSDLDLPNTIIQEKIAGNETKTLTFTDLKTNDVLQIEETYDVKASRTKGIIITRLNASQK